MKNKSAILLLLLLSCLAVMAGCRTRKLRNTWVPPPDLWERAIVKLARVNHPYRVVDSLHWPDTVTASRDYFVTDLNRFAAIFSWRYDTCGTQLTALGQLSNGEVIYVVVHPQFILGKKELVEYDRLKARDSLWTIISETEFWKSDPKMWHQALADPKWMYEKYHEYIDWENIFPIESEHRRGR